MWEEEDFELLLNKTELKLFKRDIFVLCLRRDGMAKIIKEMIHAKVLDIGIYTTNFLTK